MDNTGKQATLGVRDRTKTSKTNNTTQKLYLNVEQSETQQSIEGEVLAKGLTNHVTYESPPLYSMSKLVIHDLHNSQYDKESLMIEYIYI